MARSIGFRDTHISLAHGNGGRMMRELIEELFVPALANPQLDTSADAVALPIPADQELVVTTDGFTVQPLEFPGGNIGSLAVHGTVNDLAVSGARAALHDLERIPRRRPGDRAAAPRDRRARQARRATAASPSSPAIPRSSAAATATESTSPPPASASGRAGCSLGAQHVRAGDRILVSGPIGDHGAAVMLARQEFGLRGDLKSDAASVLPQAQALMRVPGLRFMRDPTRGGLATVAHELARATGLTVRLSEATIPVNDSVQSVCELLGFDPLYLACEGRIVAVVAPESGGDRAGSAAHGGAAGRIDRRARRRLCAGHLGYGVRRPALAR